MTLFFGATLAATGASAGEEDPVPTTPPGEVTKNSAVDETQRDQWRVWIEQLDADQFAQRNEATRQLLACGPGCIPLLVDSLGAPSREIQFRVAEILRRSFTFDEVAPQLVDAIPKASGNVARSILRDRALAAVSEAAQLENTKRLFAFWGINVDSLNRRVLFDLPDARGREQVLAAVGPLIGLRDKARLFNEQLLILKQLSLPFDHRYSPGYVIAQTLAQGLLVHDQQKIEFAQGYIKAIESLAVALEDNGEKRGAIRKEIADRANMSDGATVFLARALSETNKERKVMTERLGVTPEWLRDEFFRGLALTDTKKCYRCVGKVHITDMLVETLQKWPDMPGDGVFQSVVQCAVTTIRSGDKPKALALLDAIEGCAELQACGLDPKSGLGRRFAERLCLAALAAPNSRAYHPVRAVHDRIVGVVEAGVSIDSELFPSDFAEQFLDADPQAVSEEARLAIGRYVTVLEALLGADVKLEQPGVHQFLRLLRQELNGDRQVLKDGINELSRLIGQTRSMTPDERTQRVGRELVVWLAELRTE